MSGQQQPTFHRGDGVAAAAMLDEMADLYREVYAEPPYNSGPLWHEDAFRDRTRRQVDARGFACVWARHDSFYLAGFAFGFTMPRGAWWSGVSADPPPDEVLAGEKFAVIELIVARPWRGRGVGRQLLGMLLEGRREPYAMLTAVPDAPARQIYDHWGWRQAGRAQHTADAPVMDQLILEL